MSPLDSTHDPHHDFELSFAATRPFDFHAWLATWQQEYLFFRIDARGRINFIAPSVRDILGYEPEEMLGRDYRDYFDLDHPFTAELDELAERGATSEPPGARRCLARRADGQTAFFTLRERELRGPSGPAGKEIMGQDVTDRIEAERSLRQSERKYRRLVEGLHGDYVIYARDANGVFTYVSPSVKKVLGYEPKEIIGRNVAEFLGDFAEGQRVVKETSRAAQAG
jgi:PAS domain S-box-containing protein